MKRMRLPTSHRNRKTERILFQTGCHLSIEFYVKQKCFYFLRWEIHKVINLIQINGPNKGKLIQNQTLFFSKQFAETNLIQ